MQKEDFMQKEDRQDNPKVSVFITVYNRAQFIRQCVLSVLNQSLKDFEICICDDGSTDKTPEILEQLKQKYNTCREVIRVKTHKKNLGIARAYNTALQMCCGEYIAQLDSDDLLYKNALQKLAGFLDKNRNIGLVFSDCNVFDINRKILFFFDITECLGISGNNLKKSLFTRGIVLNHLRMFRREILGSIRVDEHLETAVDYDLYLKIAEKTEISHFPAVLYLYRFHNGNVSKPLASSFYNPFQQASAVIAMAKSAKRRARLLQQDIGRNFLDNKPQQVG